MIAPEFGDAYVGAERRSAKRLRTRGYIQSVKGGTSVVSLRVGGVGGFHSADIADYSVNGINLIAQRHHVERRDGQLVTVRVFVEGATRRWKTIHGTQRWHRPDGRPVAIAETGIGRNRILADDVADDHEALSTFFAIAECDTSPSLLGSRTGHEAANLVTKRMLELDSKLMNREKFLQDHSVNPHLEPHQIAYDFAELLRNVRPRQERRGAQRKAYLQITLRRALAIAMAGNPSADANDLGHLVIAATMAAGSLIFDLDLAEPLADSSAIQLGLAVGREIMALRDPTWMPAKKVGAVVTELSNPRIRLVDLYRSLASYFCTGMTN